MEIMFKPALVCFGLLAFALPALSHGEDMQPIQEVFEPAGNFDPHAYGKVAVVQWNRSDSTPLGVTPDQAEAFKMESRKQLERYVREAASKGAEWVITPEFSIVGYPEIPDMPPEEMDFRNPDDIRPYVESVPGPSTDYFGKIAAQLHIYLNIGLAEADPVTHAFYNTVVVLGPKGQIVAKYRKINLFELENKFLSAGSELTTFDSPFGKVGIIICADVYSSFPMEQYREAKLDVLQLSTSWARMNSGMPAFQSGATRVHAYLLAANQHYFPDSGVVNPDGSLQSHIRQSKGVAYGYLPRKTERK
jgi:predicted amidohydrolase